MQFFFPCNIQYIQQTRHIQVPGQAGIFFSCCRKNGSQQINLSNALPDDLYMQHLFIHYIQTYIRTRSFQQRILLS